MLRYGVKNSFDIAKMCFDVVDKFGGGLPAFLLLLETISVETNYATTKDTSLKSGFGLTQFDGIAFTDVLVRTSQTNRLKCSTYFDFDIDDVVIEDLQSDPLKSIIFARLKYKLIPEPIPTTLHGRAKYWKQYYNSYLGAGTVEHYIEMVSHNSQFYFYETKSL